MNQSISRLFVVVIVLFTILIVFTSRWSVLDQSALQSNPRNQLSFYASLKIKRGQLLTDNGKVLARSLKASGGIWSRQYPFGSLFAQAVGYAHPQLAQFAGLEQSYNSELSGRLETGLTSVFGPLSSATAGDNVDTTLNVPAQLRAQALLAGRIGSVVAIVPQTGAVKVMYSNPTYNDNHPFKRCPPNPEDIGCQFNLATQAELPPGSTFKVVTTAAALDTGEYTPTSIINGDSPIIVSGVPLENDGNASYGPVTLTKALTDSINTVYAQVGEKLGRQTMDTYMRRFGFYSVPPLDYPPSQMTVSGERINDKLVPVTNPNIDIGRTAIGQSNLTVTPLQMAMVVSAVADDGTLMEPRLATRAVNSDGQVVEQIKPTVYQQVMKPKIAGELTQMMTDVVEEGTGTPAQLDGIQVAGKTGTASVGGSPDGTVSGGQVDDAWFIGFAPVDHPKIAVAVELSHIVNGYGGTYAAPIAAQIIKLLLAENQ
jgi:penicillin-binding protein A